MKKITRWIIFYQLVLEAFCGVPPTAVDKVEKFLEDLNSAKHTMTNVAAQLEKFNTLYIVNMEQKMLNMATALANIDSNIKNLQERAHVWDTFQLHVAAWNEQISTLDKKVELISKSQEKIIASDAKLNAVQTIEYKVERLIGKQDDHVNLLQAMTKLLEKLPHDPIFGEFTARGVLSTLRQIERKIDKVSSQFTSSHSVISKQIVENQKKIEPEEHPKGRLLIKCNTPPKVEELLNDVAAKVDVMFDKFTKVPSPYHESIKANKKVLKFKKNVSPMCTDCSHASDVRFEKLRMKNGSEEVHEELPHHDEPIESIELASHETKNDQDIKLVKGLIKKMNQPCKRTSKLLENLETIVKAVGNTTIDILGQTLVNHDALRSCQHNQSIDQYANLLSKKMDEFAYNVSRFMVKHQESVTKQFSEQKDHFDKVLKSIHGGEANIITRLEEDLDRPLHTIRPHIIENSEHGNHLDHSKHREHASTEHMKEHHPEDRVEHRSEQVQNIAHKNSCDELEQNYTSGVYNFFGDLNYNQTTVNINNKEKNYLRRYCYKTDEGFWTVIQSRGDNKENFTRSWNEYKKGFGSLFKDFWFGNDFIYKLTNERDLMLRIELEDFNGNTAFAEYSRFKVASEDDKYQLLLGDYVGNASDSFSSHNNTKFSTYDQTNDKAPPCCPCAPSYGGGWWFYSCFEANLNGEYFNDPKKHESFRGIIWEYWLGDYSLKKTRMMVRPQKDYDHHDSHEIEDLPAISTEDLNIQDPTYTQDSVLQTDDEDFIPEDP